MISLESKRIFPLLNNQTLVLLYTCIKYLSEEEKDREEGGRSWGDGWRGGVREGGGHNAARFTPSCPFIGRGRGSLQFGVSLAPKRTLTLATAIQSSLPTLSTPISFLAFHFFVTYLWIVLHCGFTDILALADLVLCCFVAAMTSSGDWLQRQVSWTLPPFECHGIGGVVVNWSKIWNENFVEQVVCYVLVCSFIQLAWLIRSIYSFKVVFLCGCTILSLLNLAHIGDEWPIAHHFRKRWRR